MDSENEQPCPQCGGPTETDLACHTWPKTRDDGTVQWMACMPCDSATLWYCNGDAECYCSLDTGVVEPNCYACGGTGIDEGWGCGWKYTQGLNKGNPRWEDNEQRRPEWL